MASTMVKKTELLADSALRDRITEGDFVDCYQVASTLPCRKAAQIIVDFPAWAQPLLTLRKWVTAPFGLMHDGPPAQDKLGPFPVELETADELIAGFDDKHLDFRVSVMSKAGQIYLATWVHRHNIGGRIYLTVIMPFHVLIARNALKRVATHG